MHNLQRWHYILLYVDEMGFLLNDNMFRFSIVSRFDFEGNHLAFFGPQMRNLLLVKLNGGEEERSEFLDYRLAD